MAYPEVASYTSGFTTANATSTSITVPSGTQAGDLMVLLISKDGTGTFTTPSDWTGLVNVGSSAQAVGIFYRQLTAELSNFTIAHASEMTAWILLRIPGGAVPQVSSPATGNSTLPSPPSLTHSFGAGTEVMWLAFAGWDYNRTCSAYPTTFTENRLSSVSTSTGGSGVAMATLESTTNPQGPGTFTISATDTWQAYTLAFNIAPISIEGTASSDTTATAEILKITGLTGSADSLVSIDDVPIRLVRIITGSAESTSDGNSVIDVIKSIVYVDIGGTAYSVTVGSALLSKLFTLQGSASSQSTVENSDIDLLKNIGGSVASLTDATGQVYPIRGLDGSSAVVSSAESSTQLLAALQSTINNQSYSEGVVSVLRTIFGEANVVSNSVGGIDVKGQIKLEGVALSESSTEAILVKTLLLVADSISSETTSSATIVKSFNLNGNSDVESYAEASIRNLLALVGESLTASSSSSDLAIEGLVQLLGLSEITSNAEAELIKYVTQLLEGGAECLTNAYSSITVKDVIVDFDTHQFVIDFPFEVTIVELPQIQQEVIYDETLVESYEYNVEIISFPNYFPQQEVIGMPYIGATVKLRAVFPDDAGDLTTLTDVKCTITDANKNPVIVISGNDIIKEATGIYYINYLVPSTGYGDFDFAFSGELNGVGTLLARKKIQRVWSR